MLAFLFHATASTEIYTLSLHDALPIYVASQEDVLASGEDLFGEAGVPVGLGGDLRQGEAAAQVDRKSTRLNSSHLGISYAVFCLKKKKKTTKHMSTDSGTDHVTPEGTS